MTLASVLLGAALILATLRDVFHEIFHPSGTGSAAGALARGSWRLFRWLARWRPRTLAFAGPVAVVLIIAGWVAGLALGWALIYWPYLPEHFQLQSGLDAQARSDSVDALYLSLVTLSTLGYGDIVPTAGLLRAVTPLETVMGFSLFTAGLTWVLQIYPSLTRRRSLAQQVSAIRDTERETGIDPLAVHPDSADIMMRDLAAQLLTVRGDFQHFHVTYYFHTNDERSALGHVLPYLVRLAERGAAPHKPEASRFGATLLRRALDDFAATAGPAFLGLSDVPTEEVLEAYARDHLRHA